MSETKSEPRFSRLTSMKGVRCEMSRLYREARLGELPVDDASKLCHMLKALADVLRDSDLERRLAELEGTARPERIGMRGLRSVA